MKKLIILFLLASLTGWAQVPLTKPSRNFRGSLPTSPPTGFNKNQDLWMNTKDNKGYFWSGSAWYADTITTKLYQGIKGDTGAAGPSGADGRDGVCPSCPPSGGGGSIDLPFYFITSNGVDDSDALQSLVDASYNTGKAIWLSGKYKLSKGVKIKKDHKYLMIQGWCELEATNTGEWTFFYSDLPANNVEAEGVYTNRRLYFTNIVFKGQSQKQTGFDLMATEGVYYGYIWGHGLKCVVDASFALRTELNMIEANQSFDGVRLRSGVNRWANATTSNSCSNGSTLTSFRAYAAMNTNTGVSAYDVSNVYLDNIVLEGFKFNIGIDFNSTSPTATGLDVNRIHFEAANPCTESVVKVRSSTRSHFINAPNFIKPSVFVKVETSGGYPYMNLSNISSGKVNWNGTTPIFVNAGGSWKFNNCDDPFRSTTEIQKMFTGTISQGCGTGTGSNRYCIENTPNR